MKKESVLKKFFYLIALLLWVAGIIGGAGFCIDGDAYPVAVGCVLNGVWAFPKVKEVFNKFWC